MLAANSLHLHPLENYPLCQEEPFLETSGRLCPPRVSTTASGIMSIPTKQSAESLIEIVLSVMICNKLPANDTSIQNSFPLYSRWDRCAIYVPKVPSGG